MQPTWSESNDPLIGSRAGAYRLLRRLGEGGMGAVYLAEREAGFTRTAAVKLLLNGMGREEMAGRFQIEKETLAALRHPHIVALLDAGLTDDGLPYLVIEYVDGKPLDRYCASLGEDLAARLRLVCQMLDAIEFAHQRLVAHCDLKFSNVLVDAAGAVRLLDFGIAKLLNPSRYGFAGSFTKEFRPLTPEFASPEQLSGAQLTISTDVYSAGVMLYELLTGQHPFEDLLLQPVALLEAVCFEAPEKPSARAARLEQAAMARTLAGDLDAIVLRALGKDASERYASAAEFAADVRRHLAGLPVAARPASIRYRAGKFFRRNRGVSAVMLAGLIAAASGVAGTVWEGVRAERARVSAEARAGDIRALSNSLISNLYEKAGRLPGSLRAQQLLVSRGVTYLDRLAAENPADASLSLDLAHGYVKLAAVLGSPYENNVGRPQEALASLTKAMTLATAAKRNAPGGHEPKLALARIRQMRGDVLLGLGKAEDALSEARQAVSLTDQVAAARPADIEVLLQSASAHEAVADKLGSGGLANVMDPAGAARELERARELDRQVLRLAPANSRAQRGVAVLTMKLADLVAPADPAAGFTGYQDAQREFDKLPVTELETLANRRLRADLSRRIGQALAGQGRFDEAAQAAAEDTRILEAMLAIDPGNNRTRWDLAVAEHNMASLEDGRGRTLEALKHHENVAALLRRMPDVERSLQVQTALAEALVEIGSIRAEAKDRAGALAATREGFDLLRKIAENPDVSKHSLASIAESFLTALPADLQDPAFAYRCLERLGPDPQDPAAVMLLAEAQRRLGRSREATATAEALLQRLPAASDIRRRAEKFLGR